MAKHRLAIVIQDGAFERVHYALVLASSAAAIDRPVTLFFTMQACRALRPPEALGPWAAGEAELEAKGLARFETLLGACAELGVDLLVCEMGLRAVDMTESDLRDDIAIRQTGAVTFLNEAGEDAQMLFG